MTHPFKVSDKVVCVNHEDFEGDTPFAPEDDIPVIGQIYVVNVIDFIDGIPVLGLSGMNLTSDDECVEYFYVALNFRKLDDIKQMNKESRSEGILAHRRKTQPVEIMSPQDKINIARESARLKKLSPSSWDIYWLDLVRRNRRGIE